MKSWFRHEIRKYVSERNVQAELEVQNRREMAEIEAKLRQQSEVYVFILFKFFLGKKQIKGRIW